jgi:LysM repeat protein
MTFWQRLPHLAWAVLLTAALGGCLPSGHSQLEEEKESHYQAGKSCVTSLDYRGAIQEFEKALEVNPRSASAHFQLGWLYEEREPDPAAAIYHYQKYLALRPNADDAEVIRQHISNCKQDLAKTVLPLPVSPGMQHEFEQLAEENKRLTGELEKWRAYAARLQLATNASSIPTQASVRPSSAPSAPVADSSNTVSTSVGTDTLVSAASAPSARTYVVKAGDSPYSIARKAGVKLTALMDANPGLDPHRLRVGQSLNLPPP